MQRLAEAERRLSRLCLPDRLTRAADSLTWLAVLLGVGTLGYALLVRLARGTWPW